MTGNRVADSKPGGSVTDDGVMRRIAWPRAHRTQKKTEKADGKAFRGSIVLRGMIRSNDVDVTRPAPPVLILRKVEGLGEEVYLRAVGLYL